MPDKYIPLVEYDPEDDIPVTWEATVLPDDKDLPALCEYLLTGAPGNSIATIADTMATILNINKSRMYAVLSMALSEHTTLDFWTVSQAHPTVRPKTITADAMSLVGDGFWEGEYEVFVEGNDTPWQNAHLTKSHAHVVLSRVDAGEKYPEVRVSRKYVHPDTPVTLRRLAVLSPHMWSPRA